MLLNLLLAGALAFWPALPCDGEKNADSRALTAEDCSHFCRALDRNKKRTYELKEDLASALRDKESTSRDSWYSETEKHVRLMNNQRDILEYKLRLQLARNYTNVLRAQIAQYCPFGFFCEDD